MKKPRRFRQAAHDDDPRNKPEHKKLTWWIAIFVFPTVLVVAATLLTVHLTVENAGRQEAAAQSGANRAEDDELAKKPPLVADVRQLFPENIGWIWVFPNELTEPQINDMDGHLRKYGHFIFRERPDYTPERADQLTAEADQGMRAAGGLRVANDCLEVKESYECWAVSRYVVTLTGHRRERVRVMDMRARVLFRKAPPTGTLLDMEPQGGGPVEQVFADLDKPDNRPLLVDGESGAVTSPYFDVRTLWLENGESHGFELIGATRQCWCQWELVLQVSFGDDQREEVVVRGNGKADGPPFETVAWDRDGKYGSPGSKAGGYFIANWETQKWERK